MDIDVVAIGNAIVNAVAPCGVMGLPRDLRAGEARLVDATTLCRAELAFPPRLVEPGGTSVNTLMHLARLGRRCLFSGEAGIDSAAGMFGDRFRDLGVTWVNRSGDGPTGRCLVLVLPSGERTLLTSLGAAGAPLRDTDLAGYTAKVLLTEVYQFDRPRAAEVLTLAASSGSHSPWLSLSSPSAAARHRARIYDLLKGGAWTLVGTYEEFCALAGRTYSSEAHPMAEGAAALAPLFELGVSGAYVTIGSAGACHVAADATVTHAQALPVAPIVDLTGAGDAFLAGVLHKWLDGSPVPEQLRAGCSLAATVIQRWGTSPNGVLSL